jgi:hypothetical protein
MSENSHEHANIATNEDIETLDLSKFALTHESPKPTKEQKLFEKVLAAAIAADRQGLFLEMQTILDQDSELTEKQVELVWPTPKFQKSLETRGIASTKNPNLTLRQETFLQAYLNPMNLKTPQVLAKQMKISLLELDGWMRQKEFAKAMSAKAQENLEKYIPMADQALGQLVQQGDMKAITFLNQLTGRFDPNKAGSIDIVSVMMQVQDVILRHVRDPEVKRNIARELIAIANGQSPHAALPEPVSATIETETEIIVVPEE